MKINYDYDKIYNKKYDYEDMKVAMCIQDYFRNVPAEIRETYDFSVFECGGDYEDYIWLATQIKKSWQKESRKYLKHNANNVDNISGEEVGYIQAYAYRYLTEHYKIKEQIEKLQKMNF